MENQKPCFRFEIDNFSEKKDAIASQTFVSGGCEWFLYVYPKGNSLCEDYLRLYNANPKSLGSEWNGSAYCYFSLLNQSDKQIYKSRSNDPSCVFETALPLSKLREKGLLEEDRLIIEVYIKVVKAASKKKETVDNTGSQDYASQVALVRKIFAEHPEIAEEFKPKKQVLNTLRSACSKVSELVAEVKVHDWLKSKLSDFSSESKKADDDLGEVPLVTKKDADDRENSYDADGSKVQQLEDRVKNLELMENGLRLDSLKSKLEEVSLEKKKSEADGSKVQQQLEDRVKHLELMENGLRLDSLKSKLEEVSLEKKKSEADGSKVQQQLEDRVKNLELMVSDLKVELDNEKAKSSADGFLLVD
ncbi:PREDICTED: MATH domain and coiled-coil domain-containing protein At2g42480-like [Camelina sativa]|uniref:MATH domain and coiled-coil domain-containing protein At2g42480-like n=1 Tax=Camelina sativa TaxID=90675 RepID=A0ABM1RSR8_CAMSA|nr:PREDICTED: MATH domain and coiled-coil domain-containing protein At2g42480-like [Camelina sativa]